MAGLVVPEGQGVQVAALAAEKVAGGQRAGTMVESGQAEPGGQGSGTPVEQ